MSDACAAESTGSPGVAVELALDALRPRPRAVLEHCRALQLSDVAMLYVGDAAQQQQQQQPESAALDSQQESGYYSLSLEQRRDMLGAHSIDHLCKSILLEVRAIDT